MWGRGAGITKEMKYTFRDGLPPPLSSGSSQFFNKFLFREGKDKTSFIVLIPRCFFALSLPRIPCGSLSAFCIERIFFTQPNDSYRKMPQLSSASCFSSTAPKMLAFSFLLLPKYPCTRPSGSMGLWTGHQKLEISQWDWQGQLWGTHRGVLEKA